MKLFEKALKNPGTALNVYLLDSSDEMPNVKARPVILVLPGGAYSYGFFSSRLSRNGSPLFLERECIISCSLK
ncbi:hypothetical protein D3C73_1557280 [compost metagenome]